MPKGILISDSLKTEKVVVPVEDLNLFVSYILEMNSKVALSFSSLSVMAH